MPWKAFKVEGEFCVFKLDGDGDRTGKSLGCHASRKKANRQVAALNVQENKSMDKDVVENAEDKDMHVDMYGEVCDTDEFVSFGTTSFEEYDEGVEAQKASTQVKKDSKVFSEIIDNILRSDEVTDVKNSILGVAKEFASRVGENLNLKQRKKKNGDVKQMSQFMVFKDKDKYRFFTTYSNNIRDDDNPPEIIAAESHIRFEKMVDKGTVPPPQLWLWHLPSLHIGETEVIAYDKETGVAMAAGYFFKEAEPIAEVMAKNPDLWMVSHGMPGATVARSEKDETVIVQHITKEISPLPDPYHANKWVDFSILSKELSMTIPKEKLEKLKEAGVTGKMLEDVEAGNKSLFEHVEELGLERKESDLPVSDPPAEETPTKEPVEAEPTSEPEVEPVTAPATEEPAPEPVTEEDAEPTIEEAPPEDAPTVPFTDDQVTELKNTFEKFGKMLLKEVAGMLQPITDAVTEQRKSSEDALKKTLEDTPLMSLQDLVLGGPLLWEQSATKSDQTLIDGRTKDAKDGPEITKEAEQNFTDSGNPFIDTVIGDVIRGREPAKPAV